MGARSGKLRYHTDDLRLLYVINLWVLKTVYSPEIVSYVTLPTLFAAGLIKSNCQNMSNQERIEYRVDAARRLPTSASASRIFHPTWLAKVSKVGYCGSWPRYSCTDNWASLPPALSSSYTDAKRSAGGRFLSSSLFSCTGFPLPRNRECGTRRARLCDQ